MIKVTVCNNLKREVIMVTPGDTLRSALEKGGVDPSQGTLHMDGSTLRPGDINRTFAEFGLTGEEGRNACALAAIHKADNA